MSRYTINQFDADTFQIIDRIEQREICICANFDDFDDAKERAEKITALLNQREDEAGNSSPSAKAC